MYPRWTNVFLAVNSCVWPWAFAAYALLAGEIKYLFVYGAAGVGFGGLIFLATAGLQAWLRRDWLPTAGKLAGGGLIMIGWGTLGILCEALFGQGY